MTIDRDALADVLFYKGNHGEHVFNFTDERITLEDDPYLKEMVPAILKALSAVPVEGEVEWEYAAWYVNHDGSERLTRGDIGEEWVEFYRSRGMVIRRRIRAGKWQEVTP